jgi:NADPH-dependent F420 reductase
MKHERIAIIGGAGDLGFGLACRWARAGLDVRIGSRDEDRAKQAAHRLRDIENVRVQGLENVQAAADASVVVLSVPFGAQAATLKSIRGSLKDCIVVDCTVPLAVALGGKITRLIGVWEGSAAQAAREQVPKEIPVLAAFHNVSAELLQDADAPLDCDILVCGDDAAAKHRLFALIEAIDGLRAVDAGPLEMARIVEGITPLLIGINRRNKGVHAGIRITGIG